MNSILLPEIEIDNQKLTFFAEVVQEKDSELFATILTYATFVNKKDEVVFEEYEKRHTKMTEDDWYSVASQYYNDFLKEIKESSNQEKEAYLSWLDEKFFNNNQSFLSLKEVLVKNIPGSKLKLN